MTATLLIPMAGIALLAGILVLAPGSVVLSGSGRDSHWLIHKLFRRKATAPPANWESCSGQDRCSLSVSESGSQSVLAFERTDRLLLEYRQVPVDYDTELDSDSDSDPEGESFR